MEWLTAGLGSLLGSGVEAGGGLLSSIMGNKNSTQNAQNQFVYNYLLQQSQQAYQTQMANTQYQRTVADMKTAGLNPMLAAGGGMSLDSAPGGASASVGQAQSFAPNFQGVGNTAKEGALLIKTLAKMQKEIENVAARTTQTERTTPNEGQYPGLVNAQTGQASGAEQASVAQAKLTDATRRGDAGTISGAGFSAPVPAVRRAIDDTISSLPKNLRGAAQAALDNPASKLGRELGDKIRGLVTEYFHGKTPASSETPSSAKQLTPEALRQYHYTHQRHRRDGSSYYAQ